MYLGQARMLDAIGREIRASVPYNSINVFRENYCVALSYLMRGHHLQAPSDQESHGLPALELLFPDISKLAWKDIGKLRKHPALSKFRSKMRELERLARKGVKLDENALRKFFGEALQS